MTTWRISPTPSCLRIPRCVMRRDAVSSGRVTPLWPRVARRVPRARRHPCAYTPPYLAEKILTSRSLVAGERKQVTALFADLKDSTELIRGLDPEAAQQLLDP